MEFHMGFLLIIKSMGTKKAISCITGTKLLELELSLELELYLPDFIHFRHPPGALIQPLFEPVQPQGVLDLTF